MFSLTGSLLLPGHKHIDVAHSHFKFQSPSSKNSLPWSLKGCWNKVNSVKPLKTHKFPCEGVPDVSGETGAPTRHWWWTWSKTHFVLRCFNLAFVIKSKHHSMFVFLYISLRLQAAACCFLKLGQSHRLDRNFLLVLPPQQKVLLVLLDSWMPPKSIFVVEPFCHYFSPNAHQRSDYTHSIYSLRSWR